MKDTCGIYMIRNKINDKVYIGQSIHIQNRLDGHKRELRKGRHDSRHLQFAWDKYGEENFEFLSICECRKEKLNEMEQYYILCFESYLSDFGYNTSLGGQSSLMREETRIKIGNSVRGKRMVFMVNITQKNRRSSRANKEVVKMLLLMVGLEKSILFMVNIIQKKLNKK